MHVAKLHRGNIKDIIMSLPQDSAKVNAENFSFAANCGLAMESAPLLLRLRNELYMAQEIFSDMRETARLHREGQA